MTRARNLADFNTLNIDPSSLDGTGTIPSALLADVGGGIEEADQWRLTSDSLGDQAFISNWLRITTLGTGMTYDANNGTFTFPQTGIWKVDFFGSVTRTQADANMDILLKSLGGGVIAAGKTSISASNFYNPVILSTLLDVTDVTSPTFKVYLSQNSSGVGANINSGKLQGTSLTNETAVTFTRLGDT